MVGSSAGAPPLGASTPSSPRPAAASSARLLPDHVREVRRLVVDGDHRDLYSLAQAARIVTERADPTLVSALERSRGDDGACDTAC